MNVLIIGGSRGIGWQLAKATLSSVGQAPCRNSIHRTLLKILQASCLDIIEPCAASANSTNKLVS